MVLFNTKLGNDIISKMILISDELNRDQLSGLANLCFDLSKVTFAFVLVPPENVSGNIFQLITSKLYVVLIALAFTYAALVLLKLKEIVKK